MNCDSERMNYSIKLFWITSACIDHLTAEYYGKKKMVKYTCMVQYMNLIWFNKKSFCNYKKLRNIWLSKNILCQISSRSNIHRIKNAYIYMVCTSLFFVGENLVILVSFYPHQMPHRTMIMAMIMRKLFTWSAAPIVQRVDHSMSYTFLAFLKAHIFW